MLFCKYIVTGAPDSVTRLGNYCNLYQSSREPGELHCLQAKCIVLYLNLYFVAVFVVCIGYLFTIEYCRLLTCHDIRINVIVLRIVSVLHKLKEENLLLGL